MFLSGLVASACSLYFWWRTYVHTSEGYCGRYVRPSWLPYSTYMYLDFHLLFHDKTKRTQQGNLLGTSWMAIREKIFKYFDAQKVIQQISIFFKSIFHIGADCQKGYFEFFFLSMISFVTPKNFNFDRPPLRVVCPFQDFLTNIRYFSLNIWVVYDHLELDWCVFDQNWAKSRPLHFQIFQILNATDRRIVQCGLENSSP